MLLTGDLSAIGLAHFLSFAFTRWWLRVPPANLSPENYYLFYLPFFCATLYFFDGYKDQALRRPETELELVFKAVSLFFVGLICGNFILFRSEGFSRYLLAIWFIAALVLVMGSRFCVRGFYQYLWGRGLARQSALLVGRLDRLAAFQQELAIQRYLGYQIQGILVERHSASHGNGNPGLPVVGELTDWEEIAEREKATLLLLSLHTSHVGDRAPELDIIRRCQQKGIAVEVYSDLFAAPEFKYERDEFSGFFRFYATPQWSRQAQRAAKALMDRAIGLAGSIATLLITPVIALLIKLEDGGPIFYRSAYLGQDASNRAYLKFRTMCTDADKRLAEDPELRRRFLNKFKLEVDPRVTRIGRFLRKSSLDEFPQFFSVLAGHLSFVGPRTIREEESHRYDTLLPKLLSCKPGVSGFWQVMGRQNTTYEERVQMDMFYIEHWSIWLDLVIVAKTFWEVVRGRGAY